MTTAETDQMAVQGMATFGGGTGPDGTRWRRAVAAARHGYESLPGGALPRVAFAVILVALIEIAAQGLDGEARRALQIFGLALVGWTLTRLDDAFVALAAAAAMAVFVLDDTEELFEALGDELIWLMLASFMLASAFKATGLAGRMAAAAAARATTVRGVAYGLSAAMLGTAFLIPSTSGRAALMVPVFAVVAAASPNAAVRKAFALLFPTVILLSAFASMTGAGAHVLAADLLDKVADREIGFLHWALIGIPFAAVSTFLSVEAILRLFLTPDERAASMRLPEPERPENAARSRSVLAIGALVLLGWATEPLHDVDETLIALIGACAATAPRIGGVGFKEAVKSAEWTLLLFMAATIVIAEGVVESELAETFAKASLSALDGADLPPALTLGGIAGVGLLSHLVVHSRTARVAILLPPALIASKGLGLDPLAVALTLVAATGFCQLLMVSAKPVALFGALPGGTFGQRDLLRLGAVLLPLHLVLIPLFAVVVWPLLGVGFTAK